MRKLFFLLIISVLICLVSLSSVRAEKKADSSYVGWGLALGTLFFTHPEFKYESTSIGDIEFLCHSYGTTLSFFLLRRDTFIRWRPLFQGEFGVCWVHENGHKNMRLQGYPATAESNLQEIGARFGLILNYLKIWKIWLGSGFEVYGGWIRERFNIYLHRDARKIGVFNPGAKTRSGGSVGFILLSAKIFDNFWNSWELQFGYGGTDVSRDNIYGKYGLGDRSAYTNVDGWYFQIRKLFIFDLHKRRLVESKPERE